MNVYHQLDSIPSLRNTVVTSGTFDGVHIGHQKILNRLKQIAKENEGQTAVITFWPHPRTIVSNDSQDLKLLSTIDEKIELLAQNGIENLVIIPFTREFSELSSEEFVQQILVEKLQTKHLVIGYDHRFGRNREGSFDYLKQHDYQFGFKVEEIPKQEIDHLAISSTNIRNALAIGDVAHANQYLGRSYSFTGFVVKGRQLGRQLGYPTANVQVGKSHKLIPADGVYAVKVSVREQQKYGVMNIGMRPTVNGLARTQEVYIFDFDEDIYGEKLTVELLHFIRSEQKFEGIEALVAQIKLDCEKAQQLLF